eukprot:COSAG06_NODE_1644_length_8819_cov_13.898624_5_plen_1191_part_00
MSGRACFCLSKARQAGGEAERLALLRGELEALKPSARAKRLSGAGASAEEIEAAEDADEPLAACVELLAKHERPLDMDALRAELEGLKPSARRRRAIAAGATEAEVEEARDSDDPLAAFLQLVAVHEKAPDKGSEALRADLAGLKPSALKKRARAAGAAEEDIEEAGDAEDIEGAMFALILSAQSESAATAAAEKPAAALILREELSTMKISALRKRASAASAADEDVEAATDAEEPKSALIDLILDSQPETVADPVAALREELSGMKISALRKRAATAGATDEDVEAATDAEEPTPALIDLILDQPDEAVKPALQKKSDTPHFGKTFQRQKPAMQVVPAAQHTPRTRRKTVKHVMLSYQWDHQKEASRVFDLLTNLGVSCWMDIKGGMSGDIYGSMAEGVSKAFVVVCFMSQAYQDSQNCRLELQFARQSGVPVLPVVMDPSPWRAGGWLGLITAGALWTRLHDELTFDDNVRSLHSQIEQMMSADMEMEDEVLDSVDERSLSAHEATEELERLREDMTLSTMEATDAPTAIIVTDPSQPAPLSAGVPKLPSLFRATEQISELVRLVLSTSASDLSMPRVGFWGMGGIGKTVTGAAIVRNEAVRKYFHAIVWLPLGQTPVISKLQNLCHMQCTGQELSSELSSDEKKEALRQAMKGKRVLLCLDDLWEEEHETALNFADVKAGSKVLISTRVSALLSNAHQVELGLPSESDAVRMLLSSAGEEISSSAEQERAKGVHEIVHLCGRLPLALGIAGRLAASLGLVGTDDWSGMIGVLQEELRESHSGTSEVGMIRASLRGLKGSATEQENVRSLLLLFALVPEDTHCPLEVLLMMFNAVHEGSGATMMHLRKYLRILINRSLILGTIDRPSLHDLVLDFAVAQHSSEELRENHRRVVEAFRASRPSDGHGRRKYDRMRQDDTKSAYVCNEVSHHLRNGWGVDMEADDLACKGWLSDVPQDELVASAADVLGMERLANLADRAESAGDWWRCSRYRALMCIAKSRANAPQLTGDLSVRALDAISRFLETNSRHASAMVLDEVYEVQLNMLHSLGLTANVVELEARAAAIKHVLTTGAALRDPAGAVFVATSSASRDFVAGSPDVVGKLCLDWLMRLRSAAVTDPDPSGRIQCLLLAYVWSIQIDVILMVRLTHHSLYRLRSCPCHVLLICLLSYVCRLILISIGPNSTARVA